MRQFMRWAISAALVMAAAVAANAAELGGQVFSAGFDQPYKFAGVPVRVMDYAAAKSAAETYQKIDWPAAVGAATTDVDGKWACEVPPGRYMVHAEGVRRYRNGNRVLFEWRVEIVIAKEGTKRVSLLLMDENVFARRDPNTGHVIEPPGVVR